MLCHLIDVNVTMFFIVMFLFYYNYVPCALFNILMLLVILIDRPIVHSIYLIQNKDLISCILLCSLSYPFDRCILFY